MTTNDWLQMTGVVIVLAISVGYIINKIRSRKKIRDNCGSECGGCPLADSCHGKNKSGSCGCH